jgi:hypothetical protein
MLHHPFTILVAGAAYLVVTGDLVATWLLGLSGERSARRVLVAMASSLVIHALLLPAPYLWGWLPRLSAVYPALPLALGALSALGAWRAPPRAAPAPPRTPAVALLPAALVGALVLWPTLDGRDSGPCPSSDGALATTALLVDVVRERPAAAPLDHPLGVATPEGATALVLAAVAEPLGVPGLLAVQPLSALLAVVLFAALGLLLVARLEDAGARARFLPVAVLCGGAAAASTVQTWTRCSASQQLSFAILGPLLLAAPLLVGRRGEGRWTALLRGAGVGLAAGAVAVLHPGVAPVTLALAAAYLLPVWADRTGWARAGVTAASSGLAAALTGLAATLVAGRSHAAHAVGSGFLDPRDRPWTVWSDLLGFGLPLDPRDVLRPGALVAAGLIASACAVAAARLTRSPGRTGVRAGLDAALLAWGLAGAGVCLHAALAPAAGEHAAARFAATFLWIPTLAVAAAVGEAREAWRVAAAVAVVVTVVAQADTSIRFAARAAREADACRVAGADLAAARRAAGPAAAVHLSAPRDGSLTLVALALLGGRILPDERGRLLRREEFEWREQPWVLRVGPRPGRARALPTGYDRVLERPAFELWRRAAP